MTAGDRDILVCAAHLTTTLHAAPCTRQPRGSAKRDLAVCASPWLAAAAHVNPHAPQWETELHRVLCMLQLHVAARANHVAACRALVDGGADALRRNGKNRTPLSQLKVRGLAAGWPGRVQGRADGGRQELESRGCWGGLLLVQAYHGSSCRTTTPPLHAALCVLHTQQLLPLLLLLTLKRCTTCNLDAAAGGGEGVPEGGRRGGQGTQGSAAGGFVGRQDAGHADTERLWRPCVVGLS